MAKQRVRKSRRVYHRNIVRELIIFGFIIGGSFFTWLRLSSFILA